MEVLALDASYRPLEVIPWTRAFTLLYENKVEIVSEYEDKFVHTVTLKLRMPSVVRFLRHLRTSKRAIKFSRQNVWARDRGRCGYCGASVRRDLATYDHVIPRSMGGHTTWTNIVISCYACNQKKRDRTPAQAGMALRAAPVKPKVLPDGTSFTLTYRKSFPIEWKQYLVDASYWNTELDHD